MPGSLLALVGAAGLAAGLALLGLAGWRSRARGHRLWAVGTLGCVGLAALGVIVFLEGPEPLEATWIDRAAKAYDRLWSDLDRASLDGAAALETLDLESHPRLDVFRHLEELASARDVTLLLIDPSGNAAVWAGDGLLHALERRVLPSTGPVFQSSFSAVTLASVRRVGLQRTPWRLLAGRSYSSRRLPFAAPGGGRRADYLWSVVAEGSRVPERSTSVAIEGRPTMAVLAAAEEGPGAGARRLFLLRLGWSVLALGLLLCAGGWGGERKGWDDWRPRTVLGAALLALGVAAGLDLLHEALLAAGLVVLWLAERSTRRLGGGRLGTGRLGTVLLAAPAALGLVAVVAFRLEKLLGPQDLAADLVADPATVALRLALLAITLAGLLPALRWERDAGAGESFRAALCLLLLGLAAVTVDYLFLASLAVGAAAIAAGWWLTARSGSARALTGLLAVGLAALLAATTWQVMYRYLESRYLARDVAPRMGPPTAEEKEQLRDEIAGYLRRLDLEEIAPVHPWELDAADLAYALWARSPLAREGRLSSLTILLDGVPLSSFEFGLPLTAEGEIDQSPIVWQDLSIPGWNDALSVAEIPLTYRGERQGTVRWALLPRPGFRLVDAPIEQLAATLVRGSLARQLPIARLIGPANFAVYGDRARPILGPDDAPSLDATTRDQDHFVITEAGRRVEGWTFHGSRATEVLLLPAARPLATLERIGIQAVGSLLLLAALLVAAALTAPTVPARLRRNWEQLYRSYSKKLLLVYGTMLLVPLLAVTLALLGVVGERLERTREAAGEAAVDAAQHVLGEYVLSLDPGFGVDTAIDDALLDWLSRVIHHEVNLYWGSDLYASSNPELFTAGFLPERIPGEIYSALTLESTPLARRVNRASGEAYLELYAPLKVPGVRSQELLFLSVPLLAQQEEAEQEIGVLRARAVLAAIVLLVGVIVTAGRLSRGFTRPLTDLIAGTESIAAGARSLDLEPSELELAALVKAINRMAERIAEARERLVVEKQVVEKVVENITAGVVSLDAERRVLLANGVAKTLLAVEVGSRLEEVLPDEPQWEPLQELLDTVPDGPVQRTLSLPQPEGEPREWTVIWVPIPGEGEPTSLLVVEDVTEVLRGQRLEAWAEMARIIAHEIKNPLTPIRLSTQHMLEVHGRASDEFDEVFERCSRNILRQVEELQEIAGEFSAYSRIPQIRPERGDLVEAVREVVDSYDVAPPEGVEISLETELTAAPSDFDRRLLGRALRNLIENALRASRAGGAIHVGIEASDGEVAIHVEDRGPGVEPEVLSRMFDPYFSTDASGTGLGLPIARRIVEEHGGAIAAANRPGGGLRVTLRLPGRGS